ncbi:MAG: hypothetical protein ACREYC_10575 [Gammaproteobacteria bacterium]
MTESGQRIDPYFKCGWSYDLFLSQNLISHLGVYKADLGAQDYDLALCCIEQLNSNQIVRVPRVLYHWRVHSGSTAMAGQEAKPYAFVVR